MSACKGMSELPLVYPVESAVDPCAICLGKCDNQSFPKNCLHGFCFICLLQWSKVKPECPLCVKPFSSVIHNIKSNDEYDEFNIDSAWQEEMLNSEFSESADDDSSWSTTSSDSSWYTISSTSSTELLIVEEPSSYLQQYMRQEIALFRTRRESSSEESSNDIPRHESSWVTIDSEESSEDDFSISDDICSRDLIASGQDLQSLDAFLLSRHPDLAVPHNDPSFPTAPQPSRNRIGRLTLVIDEEPNNGDATELSFVRVPVSEVVYRWLQGASSSDEDNVNIESQINSAQ
ncbi:uncharacterized protein LOC130694299 [Daphnia carinata]|uniref:uncharacterized protein LOC130694299 n=1 Tax=Daphnia carinata TaxID=120202 RepID=UPI002869352C|nr:uncharacterized protein LOC130694299 [Daphnia carinata]